MIQNSKLSVDAELWDAYSLSYFDFHSKWQHDEYAIITAFNPKSQKLTERENCINNQELESRLTLYPYCGVAVGDRRSDWMEESFAVVMSKNEAILLAREFKQFAIYYVKNNQLYLISCLADNKEQHLGDIRSQLK